VNSLSSYGLVAN